MAINITNKIRRLITLAKEAANRLEKQASISKKVEAAADILANLLVEKGYASAFKKTAIAKALLQHDKALEILHEVVNSTKTASDKTITLFGGQAEKNASVGVCDPSHVNYRGYVPVDRTLAGQKFLQRILG